MASDRQNPNYSASVSLWLERGPQGRVRLSQASETFVIAAEPTVLPAGPAKIVVDIDGFRYERPVQLVDGFRADTREATVYTDDEVLPF